MIFEVIAKHLGKLLPLFSENFGFGSGDRFGGAAAYFRKQLCPNLKSFRYWIALKEIR